MGSIDDFFDLGPRLTVDTFTDRIPEAEVFARAIHAHLRHLDDDPGPDHRAPRRNVLTFYGVGGLGKTEVSRRLERWLRHELGGNTDWGLAPATARPILTTRIDLAERELVDIERIVVELRSTLGALDVQPSAFDIALTLWWQQYHGSVPTIRSARPSARTESDSLTDDIAEQLKDTATVVAEELGATFGLADLGLRVARRVTSAVRERRRRLAAEDNPWFQPTLQALEQRADLDALSRLPVLLRHDLRRLPHDERPLWVVFVDTYEHANGDGDRERERLLQRIVYAMQDVLWVVTGRSRLDWDDPARTGQLDVVGPTAWPALGDAPGESMQHRVGDLSNDDAHRFLRRATLGLAPPIADDARDMIVARAAGSPLFLDQFAKLARELTAAGAPTTADVFDVSFAGLVQRVVRDLPADERTALQHACVFPRFSSRLVVETSGGTLTEAAIARLRARGLVSEQPWPLFDLKVHDSLRVQIRQLPPNDGGWTDNDWNHMAERGLHAVGVAADDHRASIDAARDCFSLGMSVALEFALEAPWLRLVAARLPTLDMAAQSVPPIPAGRATSYAGHLAALLHCWSDTDDARPRFERLAEAAARPGMPPDLLAMAQRFRAYSVRNHGDFAGALALFDELLTFDSDGALVNLRQRAILCHTVGRFRDSVEALERIRELGAPEAAVNVVRGGIDRWHCRLDESHQRLLDRHRDLMDAGRVRMARENLADAIIVRSLLSPVDLAEIEEQAEHIRLGGLDNQHRAASMAVALAAAGDPTAFAEAHAHLEQSFRLPPEPGEDEHVSTWRLSLPRLFHAAVTASDEVFEVPIAHPMWRRIVAFWSELVDADRALEAEPADWLEPEHVVRERWQQVVLDRRDALGI
jgi:hypothetical protein